MAYQNHILAIDALISSPLIEKYLVGITSDVVGRRKSYASKNIDCKNFYILEVSLTSDEALNLEHELFLELVKDKEHIRYKKYHLEKRDVPYRKSTGGVRKEGKVYSVYIAAWLVDSA